MGRVQYGLSTGQNSNESQIENVEELIADGIVVAGEVVIKEVEEETDCVDDIYTGEKNIAGAGLDGFRGFNTILLKTVWEGFNIYQILIFSADLLALVIKQWE